MSAGSLRPSDAAANYPYGDTSGTSSCGWWIPYREKPILSRPGAVCVCLGDAHSVLDGYEYWVVVFTAVVDDFGTLRNSIGKTAFREQLIKSLATW